MKIKLTDIAFVLGLLLIFGPWLIGGEGAIWYVGYLLGAVLLAIAGYDAHAHMLGQGRPGEELLNNLLAKLTRCKKPFE
jgi:kynurenine formamidase